MSISNFLHVGITVRDIERTTAFYTKYFGFQLEYQDVFPEEFISLHNTLYQLSDRAFSDFCFLKSPDGIVLELFQFHPQKEGKGTVWNQPGYTHICLRVPDIFEAYETMKADGVYFFFPPDRRATPEEHWAFLKDPDGNLIELQD